MSNFCVVCGQEIPEGGLVCPICQREASPEMQKPRVLPFNAVKEIDGGGKDYWLEYKDVNCLPAMILNINKCLTTVVFGVMLKNGYAPVRDLQNAEYGKKWRCWTSRPTDGQREAAIWA